MSSQAYSKLCVYIEQTMSMAHVYQPVMLMQLLTSNGTAHKDDIAKSILSLDQSQIDYYSEIVPKMPGKYLRKHDVVSPGPRGSGKFTLNDYNSLSDKEVSSLFQLCQIRLDAYIEKRGERIWAHRDHTRKAIPGTIRYQVLKRAETRCELCGIHDEVRALEVDHIIPKSKGGPDTLENYQALCYRCNTQKKNLDDTDFRQWRTQYEHKQDDCFFCTLPTSIKVLAQNELASVLKDNFPVSPGHSLIIPKRHVATYFDMNQAEINACNRLIKEQKIKLETDDKTITGFNIGMNAGSSAGQTIFHAHIHLIPRRDGDQENPRGGVRKVFPDKADYKV